MIRLLKPLEHYERKYGTRHYALEKLYLMMEKQHNRGQEGAGVACVRLHQQPGREYMFREKAEGKDAITKVFSAIYSQSDTATTVPDAFPSVAATVPDASPSGATTVPDASPSGAATVPDASPSVAATVPDASASVACEASCPSPFHGELYMGHLRYSTTGSSGLKYVHPFLRRNNWRAKNLCLCGNFNMTNIEEVFRFLTAQGQYPRAYSDTYITLELMGHRLDREVERNFNIAREQGLEGTQITDYIDTHVDMANVLRTTMPHFDGGYVMCGMTGSGEMFSMRDPWGIRPAFYYVSDEIVAIASERPVLQTTFDIQCSDIRELQPGEALIVNYAGEMRLEQIIRPARFSSCSFEHIYFSRGNDEKIHNERKQLGAQLCDDILKAIDNDIDNTVFSFIPNTAEVAYYGMVEEMRRRADSISSVRGGTAAPPRVRAEKVVWKDIKLRTFITEGSTRNDLAAHVYDVTFGIVRPGVDNLVVIDDSIVRGTTLRESIIRILDRLHPRKLIIVSSAPQIRYPDFYGIDMPDIHDFIAYQATALLHERDHSTADVEHFYDGYTVGQINSAMVELLRTPDITTPVELVFQSIEGLHKAIPDNPGDWYFTGRYPTPGGYRLLRQQNN